MVLWKRNLFNWQPELIDIDFYEETRVSEKSVKYWEIVGDVGEILQKISEMSVKYN